MKKDNEGLKPSFKRERADSGQIASPPRTKPTHRARNRDGYGRTATKPTHRVRNGDASKRSNPSQPPSQLRSPQEMSLGNVTPLNGIMNANFEGLKQSFKRERAGSGQIASPPRTKPTHQVPFQNLFQPKELKVELKMKHLPVVLGVFLQNGVYAIVNP
jgi:hypothetical protein